MANLKEVKITGTDGAEMTVWMEEDSEGRSSRGGSQPALLQNLTSMQDTIKSFTQYTLNSFKQMANANIDKVTLEFGINVSADTGIPYIAKGAVGSNIKITVQCSFTNNP